MEDQLITFKTAKLAKEKGVDIETINWYDQTETLNPIKESRGSMFYTNEGYAPTQSLLQKWLRETHNIHLYIKPYDDEEYDYTLLFNNIQPSETDDYFKTYEEALETGLEEALKLIPQKK